MSVTAVVDATGTTLTISGTWGGNTISPANNVGLTTLNVQFSGAAPFGPDAGNTAGTSISLNSIEMFNQNPPVMIALDEMSAVYDESPPLSVYANGHFSAGGQPISLVLVGSAPGVLNDYVGGMVDDIMIDYEEDITMMPFQNIWNGIGVTVTGGIVPGTLSGTLDATATALTLTGTWGGSVANAIGSYPGGFDMATCTVTYNSDFGDATDAGDPGSSSATFNVTPVYTEPSGQAVNFGSGQVQLQQATIAAPFVSTELDPGPLDPYTLVLSALVPGRLQPLSGATLLSVTIVYDNGGSTFLASQTDSSFSGSSSRIFGGITTPPFIPGRNFSSVEAYLATIAPKCNFNAITGPSILDDVNLGYSAGSLWIAGGSNLSVCVDPAAGAANWRTVILS